MPWINPGFVTDTELRVRRLGERSDPQIATLNAATFPQIEVSIGVKHEMFKAELSVSRERGSLCVPALVVKAPVLLVRLALVTPLTMIPAGLLGLAPDLAGIVAALVTAMALRSSCASL
ncbi:hypothetical protein XH80_03345 [Bradyrhizobium sp. CCBAU 45384]|nr:hypothetical protein [Bradyrhizobium sp. CCBAU 45384]